MFQEKQANLNAVLSLNNQRLFFAIVVFSIAPIWFGDKLPLVDLPQHAAQVSALREIWSGNALFTESFRVNWFTPYLLGYMLLFLLSSIFPVAVAAQILVSIAVAAIPIATGLALRAAGADERWKWLAIPGSYGFAFYWGFLTFIVSAPLVLLFFIQTIRFAEVPTLRRSVGIAVLAFFLFFCHVIVLGFASLVALSYLCGRVLPNWRALVFRAIPYAAPLPLIAVWMLITYEQEAAVQADTVTFGPISYRLASLLFQPAGRESLDSLFIPLLVTGSIVLLPMLAGARISRRPERLLPFCVGLAIFLIMPHQMLHVAYLYQRLGVFLVPLWLLLWDVPAERRTRLDWVAMLVVTIWVLSNAARFAAFAKETQDFRVVMNQAEPGKTLAGMTVENGSPLFYFPVYLHFTAWYQAEKHGIADFNFADFHPQMVRYRAEIGPRLDDTLSWFPGVFQWDVHGGSRYDYFLMKSSFDASQAIFKSKRDAVELVAQSGWWWLYKNKDRRVSNQASCSRGFDCMNQPVLSKPAAQH